MNIKRIGFVKKGEEVNTALYLYIACLYVKGGNIGIFGRSCLWSDILKGAASTIWTAYL